MKFYHKIRSKESFKPVMEKGLIPADENKHIYLSSSPDIWGVLGTGAILEIDLPDNVSIERDPEVLGAVSSEIGDAVISGKLPISHDGTVYYDEGLVGVVNNRLKYIDNADKFKNVLDDLREIRKGGNWDEYKLKVREFLDNLTDEEWKNLVGYYRTRSKISPDMFRVYDDLPIVDRVSIKLGYPGFYSCPPRIIGSDDFVREFINESGGIEEAKVEFKQAYNNRAYSSDDRMKKLKKALNNYVYGNIV